MRLVLDTNVFVSVLIRPGATFQTLVAFIDRRATILYSPDTLTELVDVLGRSKFAPYTTRDQTAQLTRWIIRKGELVTVDRSVARSRDADDDKFLALATSGQADYLVTGDKDLLVLGHVGSSRIVSPAQFISLIRQNETEEEPT
jgi:putative PIN family toxin of toxin-antitoxin system